jgi:hypothetical protein
VVNLQTRVDAGRRVLPRPIVDVNREQLERHPVGQLRGDLKRALGLG